MSPVNRNDPAAADEGRAPDVFARLAGDAAATQRPNILRDLAAGASTPMRGEKFDAREFARITGADKQPRPTGGDAHGPETRTEGVPTSWYGVALAMHDAAENGTDDGADPLAALRDISAMFVAALFGGRSATPCTASRTEPTDSEGGE